VKLVHKVNGAVVALLAASALVVGAFFVSSYHELRDETYRWFDAGARGLAVTIGGESREAIAYFDYKTLEESLKRRVREDPNLSWVGIAFGGGLKERREAGDAAAGPFREYRAEVRQDGALVAQVTIHYRNAEVEAKLDALGTRLAVGSGVTLVVLVGVLSALVARFVTRPLGELVRHAEVAAAGDLTATAPAGSDDEFGALARTLNLMTGNLREMVAKAGATHAGLEALLVDIGAVSRAIAAGSGEQSASVATASSSIEQMNASIKSVVQSVEHLYALAGESSSSMLEMSSSVEQVAGNADGLSGAAEQASTSIAQMTASTRNVAESVARLAELVTSTSAAVTEIEATVREVERNAGESHELSREVAQTMSEEGLVALQRTGEGMRAIRESVGEAAAVIRTLEARSHEIGSIVSVINDVNDQTNLLALNAAILAAQAGEHGRGFAVVAEEIRELSARTGASTKEIAGLIAAVRKESSNAVVAMEHGTRRVEEGVGVVEELGATLRRAAENSGKASAASRGIAQATSEQYKGIRQVTTSTQTIDEMSHAIARATREQTAGGAQIVKAAEELRDLAHQVKRAMAEQAKGIRQTSRASEESARLSQQVLGAAREEAKGSDLVVKTIWSIQQVSDANSAAVKRLDEVVGAVAAQSALLKQELGRFRTAREPGAGAPGAGAPRRG
jgi:methyl-accepting chemotaxis protein